MKSNITTPKKDEIVFHSIDLTQLEKNILEQDLHLIDTEREAIFLSIANSETGIASLEQQAQLDELDHKEYSIQSKQSDWELSKTPTPSPYFDEITIKEPEPETERLNETLDELEQLRESSSTQDLEPDL